MSKFRPPRKDADRDAHDLWLLSAFVDDELPKKEREAVQMRLQTDARAAEIVRHYRAQKASLKAVFPISPNREMIRIPHPPSHWRPIGIACGWLALGIALGATLGPLSHRWDPSAPAFARRANIAYAVYAPEQRHPVEVAASQEDHLVQWLSNRLGHPLSAPSLAEYGYSLVGGRLLPGESGPAAQFMYQNRRGERLTLYITPAARAEAPLQWIRDKNRRTLYWVNDQMGYALSGGNSEGEIRSIAQDVCSALGGHPERW